MIAFHVSNRFLDLKPVLLAIAEKHGLEYAYVHETGERRRHDQRLGADHAPQAVHPAGRRSSRRPSRWRRSPDWRLWTDDYNNLIQVFKH